MEALDVWLGATGADRVDGYRDLLHRALNPPSDEREPLVLPNPESADARAVMALLKKGQVPTHRAVAAGAANPRPWVVLEPARQWSDEEIDRFGQVGAGWLHQYRLSRGGGPTWTEFFSSTTIARSILDEFDGQSGDEGVHGYLRRDRDRLILLRRGRRRGWFAFSDQPRSLCAGPSFFVSGFRAPDPVGRRVASVIRQFHAADEKRYPQWADIADVLDGDGNRVFRDVEDAEAQAGWLATEQWIRVKSEGVALGYRAKREQKRNGLRSARKRLSDQSLASEPVSTD